MSAYDYPGDELTLFAHAHNWKRYFGGCLRDRLRGDVLEVGAGLGETTRSLRDGREKTWVCLEPDPKLAAALSRQVAALPAPGQVSVVIGTLATLPPETRFHAILYIDVLEHIEDDREELRLAAARLHPGGSLVVLAPAHMALYSPFDKAIGHYRRYDRRMLRAVAPAGLIEQRIFYLDAVGMFCSLANRWLLHKSQPHLRDILFWDRTLVPLSRVLDPLLGRRVGRSVIAIWERPADDRPAATRTSEDGSH